MDSGQNGMIVELKQQYGMQINGTMTEAKQQHSTRINGTMTEAKQQHGTRINGTMVRGQTTTCYADKWHDGPTLNAEVTHDEGV
ncbi:hypothetical protein [Paenibacillus sp. URB8-2]|uniref:hypothetical protein n=1 Tax=Paenibacillus sp. URB8-2 TaxID=2741301 RepID=UPI0015B9A185|nr:hypothetical protein [Paenibacillus sp. URB8-2]BCG60860.1 hypothetical protein PUR_42850 [Paenibacillus sp. URB8-2]